MPLRIWMPSWAAGPENTAACPRTTLSPVTPLCAHAGGATAITHPKSQPRTVLCLMPSSVNCVFSCADGEKLGVLRQKLQVELAPPPALNVVVLGLDPGCARRRVRARLQLLG